MMMAIPKLSTTGTKGRCRGDCGVQISGGVREVRNEVMRMALSLLRFPTHTSLGSLYPSNSAYNAFASWRSAVAKPSVNQP
jgi:hypothetical protein